MMNDLQIRANRRTQTLFDLPGGEGGRSGAALRRGGLSKYKSWLPGGLGGLRRRRGEVKNCFDRLQITGCF